MKILFDTSVLIEIDRKNSFVIDLVKKLTTDENEFFISIVTVTEILTGAYLQKQKDKVKLSKELLMQFNWVEYDGQIAESTAKIIADSINSGKMVEFQDNVIASSFVSKGIDYLLTMNKKHFESIGDKVFTPAEFEKKILEKD